MGIQGEKSATIIKERLNSVFNLFYESTINIKDSDFTKESAENAILENSRRIGENATMR